MDYQDICLQIEDTYSQLSPQLKRAARHALDHPDDVALLSMRRFAAKADVHPSTMTRLVKVLGIAGYTAFQQSFQARLRTKPEELYSSNARAIQARGADSAHVLIDEMMSNEHSNLDSIAELIGHDALTKSAQMIAQARHVYVGGERSCYPAAFYFQYACRMFSNHVSLIDGGGGTFADDLRGVGKDDVLLVISFAPYSQSIVHAVDYAAQRGAHILALTDSTLSPVARGKNVTPLIVRTSSSSFFHSVVPAMSVVQTLVLLLVAKGGKGVVDKLAKSTEQLRAFNAYWTDNETLKLRSK